MNIVKQDMSPEEYNKAVRSRYEEDKANEWEDEVPEDIQHNLRNDSTGYLTWKKLHICKNYADFHAEHCVICGAKL